MTYRVFEIWGYGSGVPGRQIQSLQHRKVTEPTLVEDALALQNIRLADFSFTERPTNNKRKCASAIAHRKGFDGPGAHEFISVLAETEAQPLMGCENLRLRS